jgi:hypothetical protein
MEPMPMPPVDRQEPIGLEMIERLKPDAMMKAVIAIAPFFVGFEITYVLGNLKMLSNAIVAWAYDR